MSKSRLTVWSGWKTLGLGFLARSLAPLALALSLPPLRACLWFTFLSFSFSLWVWETLFEKKSFRFQQTVSKRPKNRVKTPNRAEEMAGSGENEGGGGGGGGGAAAANLEVGRAERAVWLLKVPTVVGQSWQQQQDASNTLARVSLSLDPLNSDPQSAVQVFLCLRYFTLHFNFKVCAFCASEHRPSEFWWIQWLMSPLHDEPLHLFAETRI